VSAAESPEADDLTTLMALINRELEKLITCYSTACPCARKA
jgi:hypothetical protein